MAWPNVGRKGAFVKIAKAIGFKAPWTSTPARPELFEQLNGMPANLGPYPYTAIDESGRQKQETRLLEGHLPGMWLYRSHHSEWIDTGLPTCGCGTEKELSN